MASGGTASGGTVTTRADTPPERAESGNRKRRWPRLLLGLAVVAALAVASQLVMPTGVLRSNPLVSQTGQLPSVDAAELAKAAQTRVFFGHQSVGANVLSGIPAVYEGKGVTAPAIKEGGRSGANGSIVHAYIGENGNPTSKIQAFEAAVRGGLGSQVDVALMKFCYLDIQAGMDVDAVFAGYRDMLAGLKRDYPNVTFVPTTVPLTTEPGLKWRVKNVVGRADPRYGVDENVARERFNALVRTTYAGQPLWDIAAIESIAPDGTRMARTKDGQSYYALHDAYGSDSAHLNANGAQVAATGLLKTISQASRR